MRVPQLLHLGGAEQRAVALARFEGGAEPAEEPGLPGERGVEGAAEVKR